MDTFLVAREALILRNNLKIPSIVLKVDFRKAFDTISWEFLMDLLKAKGFPEKWITWIHNLLISSSSTVKVNGHLGPTFFHQRGLRQGDPLSPLLFNMVADTLQALLTREKDKFYGMPTLHVPALQFADDTLLISEAHPFNLQGITRVLKDYGRMTGLVTNPTKSTFATIHIPQNLIPTVEKLLGCKAKPLPMKYLGLPLTIKKTNKGLISPITSIITTQAGELEGLYAIQRRAAHLD
jgi:hypothetical protein